MKTTMNLEFLKIEHDYYCGESYNHFVWNTFFDFEKEYNLSSSGTADDLNLIIRWDFKGSEDPSVGTLYLVMLQQRKCKLLTHTVIVTDSDTYKIIKYLSAHKKHIDKIWEPINGTINEVDFER